VIDVSGDGGRYAFQSWLSTGKRGHPRFLFFFAPSVRCGCEPNFVLLLGRHEKHDYAIVVIPRLLRGC
jgi:hypothetical protein